MVPPTVRQQPLPLRPSLSAVALAAQASVPIHYAELQALEEKRQLDR